MCRAIIEEFSHHTVLPVKIQLVVDSIKDRGFASRVVFHPEDEDPELLAGMLFHSIPAPYTAQTEVADVVYSTRMHAYDQRLVACKELLHTAERPADRTASRDAVSALISGIVLSQSAKSALKNVRDVFNDDVGVVSALAVLMPAAARDNLMPVYTANKISLEDIADLAELPLEMVELVFMNEWPLIVNTLFPSGPEGSA